MSNQNNEKYLLITGGAGFIGSHAVRLFLERGEKVVVFDNLERGFRQVIETLKMKFSENQLVFVEGDLRNVEPIEAVFDHFEIKAVLHFAALCLVDESMQKPELYFQNNVIGTLNLLEAMRHHNVKRLIFSSTCAVYGESQYLPLDEKHPTHPLNPYGQSKLMAESMIRWYGELHAFSFAILRYFNVCGSASDGLIGDSKKPSQLLMQNAVRGAMEIEPFYYTCPQVDTPDGTPIRDYIDVEDLVAAHAVALDYLEADGKSGIFNLGNGKGYSVKEIVSAVEKAFDLIMEKHLPEKTRQGEYAAVYAEPQKANELLGWKPKKSIDESVESLRKWYTAHPQGWEY